MSFTINDFQELKSNAESEISEALESVADSIEASDIEVIARLNYDIDPDTEEYKSSVKTHVNVTV